MLRGKLNNIRVNGGNDERRDDKPLWGMHVRDRFALAVISLRSMSLTQRRW